MSTRHGRWTKHTRILVLLVAVQATTMLALPFSWLEKRMIAQPEAMMSLLAQLLLRLSPVVFLLDWSLEWIHLSATDVLVEQGEEASSIYMVGPAARPSLIFTLTSFLVLPHLSALSCFLRLCFECWAEGRLCCDVG